MLDGDYVSPGSVCKTRQRNQKITGNCSKQILGVISSSRWCWVFRTIVEEVDAQLLNLCKTEVDALRQTWNMKLVQEMKEQAQEAKWPTTALFMLFC